MRRKETAASTRDVDGDFDSATAASDRGGPLPAFLPLQLATLVAAPPAGDQWLHELKYDGYRIACRLKDGKVRLLSRNRKDWTSHFPRVRDAAADLPARTAFLDGEVAVVLPDGRTSFQALQNSLARTTAQGELVYFLFDLLHLDGQDLTGLPLEQRKARLRGLLEGQKGPLRYAADIVGRGPSVFAEACHQGAEGIVCKRRDLPHRSGRSTDWVKVKCVRRQEFVIGGFTDPQGSRSGIGALLVGVYDGHGRLAFAGKVGTGFSQAAAGALRNRLGVIATHTCPFAVRPAARISRNAHWVDPTLVAEVAFTEWTADNKIRHPSFQGLREDKASRIIRREEAQPVGLRGGDRRARDNARPSGADRYVAGVHLTHSDRLLYPEDGFTKADLARYYEAVAEWILPHVRGRPLTLVRCPRGVGRECFFMKHSRVWGPSALRRVKIQEKRKVGEYLVAEDTPGLIALVQMDVLEIHTWNSTVDHLEQPDRVVFDLDPGPEVAWRDVVEAAKLVRQALKELQLTSFVKTTGGRGLHVVVPLVPVATWDQCLAFARGLAETLARQDAQRFTTAFAKAGRERHILIDYLRNNRTNTSIAPYSPRARPGAPVSVPLRWDQLSTHRTPDRYDIRAVQEELRRIRDPWSDYPRLRQHLNGV